MAGGAHGRKPPPYFQQGVVALSESKTISCGGLALDLLLKFVTLIRESDGTIKLADDYKAKICHIFAYVKTVKNMDKIIRDLAGRSLSVDQRSSR